MSTARESLVIETSAELKRQFSDDASRLHLSPSAYLLYLMARQKPGVDAARLDRMVGEVFGRYGEVMRKLAE